MLFDPAKYLYAECDGKRIAYQRSGKGPVVLMIHGITTYSFIWRKLIPYLESDYDLIRIDLLGCGHSDMSATHDLSLKNHARLLYKFIEELKLPRLHLVGHDLGGGIVQIMGVKHPEKYLSISMLNPVAYNYWPVQPISSMRTPIFRQLAMAAFDMGYYRSIVKKALYKPESFTQELLELFWSNFDNPNSKKSFLRFTKCLNNNDLMEISDEIKAIAIPVLLLRGEGDVFLSSGITARLHEEISGSKFVVMPETGHYMQEDSPGEISEALTNFWSTI